ncbi:hypothetical protein [Xanthomonas hortorum]|uniref:Uncharacterized protein n=1 Tax=Xanthomonas hortorum TaxID=56454 RepID=A0AA47IA04_9XANT|nr:hypothetical protein [Xanthomonas hortorum]WAH62359.1 hypothetical protein OEG85_12475 [Xanthomonas hortorum]
MSHRNADSKENALALRDSYLYHVLRFLRSGQARTAEELLQLLDLERGPQLTGYAFRLKGPRTVERMKEVLIGLAEIGIVPIEHDGGTDGGDGGDGGRAGAEDGEGGRGLSEVLGHAVLFCLADESQDALLDAAFGIDPKDRRTSE